MSDKASSIGAGGSGIGGFIESSVVRPSSATFFPNPVTHPASAPDYLYHGLPSSSPASSESPQSDYGRRAHRTSPGPTPSVLLSHHHHALPPRSHSEASLSFTAGSVIPSASASASTSTSASTFTSKSSFLTQASPVAMTTESVDLSDSASKRQPLKRAETLPNIALGLDAYAKPAWSYAALIGQAIFSTETRKISLAEIYTFIMASYPYYKKEDSGWQNSIRHNLSLNECFIKTMRGPSNPGKGCLWAISVGCEEQFADGGFTKKGAPGMVKKGSSNGSIPDAPSSATSSSGRAEGKSNKRARGASQSSRGGSPAASFTSNHDHVEHERSSQTARAFSPGSGRGSSPPTPPPIALSLPKENPSVPLSRQASSSSATMMKQHGNTFNKTRRGSDASVDSLSSIEDDEEAPAPVVKAQKVKPSNDSLASAYVHRPALPQTSPALSLSRVQPFEARRKALTSPAGAYQMYDQTSRPYEVGTWQQQQQQQHHSSNQNHRALALLASPEHSSSIYNRQQLQHPPQHQVQHQHYHHQQGRPIPHPSAAQSSIATPLNSGLQSHFLPAPHIFPGSQSRAVGGRNGNRIDHDEKEMNRRQSVMSPSSMVHTRSPVSFSHLSSDLSSSLY